ncbi:MAG TPA: hypothetical protein VGW12_11895 [Pyrinomonadaceae bacterium]|nr:hypothetical protein [Pyrinomonadaceae bacterium]
MEQNWTTRQHPEGFTLDVPAAWGMTAEEGRVNVFGPNRERLTIMPLRLEAPLHAEHARDLLLALVRQFWPEQRWQMPRGGWQFNQQGVAAVGADERVLKETAALWWANTPDGAAIFFYALAAPPALFPRLTADFARILNSFRMTGGSGGQPASSNPLAGIQFQTWVDPLENAFSIQVPAGWHVKGGVFRPTMVAQSEFVIQSPDGQIVMRSGDVNFPSKFMVPDMNLMMNGLWEGQSTGGYLIMNYKSARDFAAYYIQNTVGRNSQNLQWLGARDRTDRVQALAWYMQALGFTMHTGAELNFSCQFSGRPYVGYQYAETAVTHQSHVATLWEVQALFGFIAPPESARLADAVLFHAIASFQMNPQWMMQQQQMNAVMAENLRRYREHSNQLWQQTQAERWASWDRISEQRGDVLRGHTRVVDPTTNQAYKVQSGSSYYSIDPTRQVIVGTDIPFKPDWNYQELIETYY